MKQNMTNPFTVDSSNMLNGVTKQGAIVTTMKTLETVEQVCKTELQQYLNDNSKSKRYVTAYLTNCNIKETIGEYECSNVSQAFFESNGLMCHGYKAGWLTAVLKEPYLKMEENLLDCHTFGTGIFGGVAITRTYTMVYKLRVDSKCHCNCSCAYFQVPYCSACKCKGNDIKCGQVMPVRTLVSNNGYDKSDTDDLKQCLRCD